MNFIPDRFPDVTDYDHLYPPHGYSNEEGHDSLVTRSWLETQNFLTIQHYGQKIASLPDGLDSRSILDCLFENFDRIPFHGDDESLNNRGTTNLRPTFMPASPPNVDLPTFGPPTHSSAIAGYQLSHFEHQEETGGQTRVEDAEEDHVVPQDAMQREPASETELSTETDALADDVLPSIFENPPSSISGGVSSWLKGAMNELERLAAIAHRKTLESQLLEAWALRQMALTKRKTEKLWKTNASILSMFKTNFRGEFINEAEQIANRHSPDRDPCNQSAPSKSDNKSDKAHPYLRTRRQREHNVAESGRADQKRSRRSFSRAPRSSRSPAGPSVGGTVPIGTVGTSEPADPRPRRPRQLRRSHERVFQDQDGNPYIYDTLLHRRI